MDRLKFKVPENEAARLEALERFAILDTLAEQSYDDITLLAAHIAKTPMAMVTFVDADRQWFKSKIGIQTSETSREIAFCSHAILEPFQSLCIQDAQQDDRFADNPSVTGAPNIRFYFGAPLVTPENFAVGTLCVIDRVPRTLSPEQQEALEALSRQVVAQLELRRNGKELEEAVAAQQVHLEQIHDYQVQLEEANAQLRYEGSTDPLTGIHNRASFDKRLREEISRAVRYLSPLSFLMIDVDRFKKFNDTFGHQVGDAVLRTVAKSIDYLRPSDFVARYGGEEFAVILPATGRDGALILAERIRARVESIDFEHGPLTVSIGVSTPALRDLEETRLIEAADKALYKAKQMGRNSVIHADSLKVS